ncbi:hypothetical protein Zmor_024450 [Zophobas morio]|uniref:Uncharacterized protein n=1 Tax=Zophobas morio TaxID=2755281 RepID=A0AA38HYT2_9CUCU|nr:hypothetical protein Zmor_024450 [Zophobas morio]
MQRQGYQSAVRVWRQRKYPLGASQYERSLGLPVVTVVPHDGDSIYRKHYRTVSLYYGRAVRQAVTVANSQLGLDYWAKSTDVISSAPEFYSNLHLCADSAINPASSTRNRALRFHPV